MIEDTRHGRRERSRAAGRRFALAAGLLVAVLLIMPAPLDAQATTAERTAQGIQFPFIDLNVRQAQNTEEVTLSVQLLVLLADCAPADRECGLRIGASQAEGRVQLSLASDGFALDPLITEELSSTRSPPTRTRASASVSMVRDTLTRYGAHAHLERAPQGSVGAVLIIDMAAWGSA